MAAAHSPFPDGVIDVAAYHEELSLVRSWLESAPDKTPQLAWFQEAGIELAPYRNSKRIAPRRAKNAARVAVASGQYLLWYHSQHSARNTPDCFVDPQHFSDLFALHWSLLKRRLQLDVAMAADLIKIDRASRGDTELRHALVALLERNFAPIAPAALLPLLRDWADELSIERKANFRKLAQRIWKLSSVAT